MSNRILFLKGIFLSDCDDIYDLFDKQLLEQVEQINHSSNIEHMQPHSYSAYNYNPNISENKLESISYKDSNSNNKIIFDKIPEKFIDIESWKKNTNLQCWYCSCNFSVSPKFIPKYVHSNKCKDEYVVYGNFCSFNCARKYSIINMDKEESWSQHEIMKILYPKFYNKKVENILPSPDKEKLEIYGGNLTVYEYKKEIEYLKKQQENEDHIKIENILKY